MKFCTERWWSTDFFSISRANHVYWECHKRIGSELPRMNACALRYFLPSSYTLLRKIEWLKVRLKQYPDSIDEFLGRRIQVYSFQGRTMATSNWSIHCCSLLVGESNGRILVMAFSFKCSSDNQYALLRPIQLSVLSIALRVRPSREKFDLSQCENRTEFFFHTTSLVVKQSNVLVGYPNENLHTNKKINFTCDLNQWEKHRVRSPPIEAMSRIASSLSANEANEKLILVVALLLLLSDWFLVRYRQSNSFWGENKIAVETLFCCRSFFFSPGKSTESEKKEWNHLWRTMRETSDWIRYSNLKIHSAHCQQNRKK